MFSVHTVTVYVEDLDRALDFYVNRLGCELRVDRIDDNGARFVEVAPPGGGTRLSLVAEGAEHRAGGTTGISLNADEIHSAYRTLTERGVKFTQTPTPRENGGVRSQFVDPDGNSFLLNQHPTPHSTR